MKKFIVIFILILCFNSCNQEADLNHQKASGYTIEYHNTSFHLLEGKENITVNGVAEFKYLRLMDSSSYILFTDWDKNLIRYDMKGLHKVKK